MAEVLESTNKWDSLIETLEHEYLENQRQSKGKRLTNSEFFQTFADVYDTTPSSVSYYFYKFVKPKFNNKEESNDESGHEMMIDEPKEYKVGDTIHGQVVRITDYGVFVKVDEENSGLIHISEITHQYVTMPEDYFYFGEEIEAKVIKMERDGKLGLSTKALGGKKKLNESFVPNKVEPIKNPVISEEIKKNFEVNNIAEPTNLTPVFDKEKDGIIAFIKQYSGGNVSSQALADIQEMIDKNGVFQTTMSLVEAIRDLDISSYITEKAKSKLTGEYLRRG